MRCFFLFTLQYLGSVIVKRVHGTQSTEEACLRLRVRTEGYTEGIYTEGMYYGIH